MLGDPIYQGADKCIVRRIGRHEAPENVDKEAINVFNKMHASFRVRVEWGIIGLKRKWRRLTKHSLTPQDTSMIL